MRVESQLLRNFVCGGAVASLTLTFFDPVMWSAVGLFLGLGLLLLVPVAMSRAHTEPPQFFFALAWIVTAGLLAFAYGATQEFYNIRQVGFLLIGLVVGFLISLVRVPQWAAWTPFGLLALYFGGLAILGRDPADSLTQNSRNYVSVMLLAMFASAMLLSKPMTVRPLHVVMALLVLPFPSGARAGLESFAHCCSPAACRLASCSRHDWEYFGRRSQCLSCVPLRSPCLSAWKFCKPKATSIGSHPVAFAMRRACRSSCPIFTR